MTDNKIIKALECCAKSSWLDGCDGCPCFDPKEDIQTSECQERLMKYALELINRQKAEIEGLWICVDELKKEVGRHERNYDPTDETQEIIKKIMGKDGTEKVLGKIKAKAYKEFAERVHCHCESIINQDWNKKVAPVSWADAYEQFDNEVDNLLEELKGENNEKTKKND